MKEEQEGDADENRVHAIAQGGGNCRLQSVHRGHFS
jgi:hypothetical protein